MSVLQYTPPKATWDRVENPRARTTSVSVSCACRQSGPEAKRKHVFREVTVAWAQAYGQGDSLVSLQQVQRWPCGYFPSMQSRSLLAVPCHCSFTQPNTCIRSLASTINSCWHSPFLMRTSSWMDGLCQELPAYGIYLACAESVSFKADSMENLAAKKVESGRNRKRMDNLPIEQVQWGWFFSSISSLLLRLLREFSFLRAALSGQQKLHSRLCGDHRNASQQSSPRQ